MRQATPNPNEVSTPRKVVILFPHGLGDAVELTIVLRHLQVHRSNWEVDVGTLIGKHSAFHGLCHAVYVWKHAIPPCCKYRHKFALRWEECQTAYSDSPSTKSAKCLREVFGIAPDPELCRYSIHRGNGATERAQGYLERVCQGIARKNGRYPAVLIHYEGNTSPEMKNIPADVVRRVCDDVLEHGLVPIILDWDFRTPLVKPLPTGEQSRIQCPDTRDPLWQGTGTGDAETLAALIELSSLMIGVDSGPLHVAGATTTPTLGIWTRHHPLHHFSQADNVTHMVPVNHADLIRGDASIGSRYFRDHYFHQTYGSLEEDLRFAVRQRLYVL